MTAKHNADLPATLTTEEAAAALHRKPQTIRRWAFTNTGPIQPIRIGRRLAWPVDAIKALLSPNNDAGNGSAE